MLKFKKALCFIITMVMSVSLTAVFTFANPITTISSAEDFLAIEADGCYSIDADIDFSGKTFTSSVIPEFSGAINGNGHKITGLNIKTTEGTTVSVGLFGKLTGNIQSLVVEGSIDVTHTDADKVTAGGIAAVNSGSITNCASFVDITVDCGSRGYVGGISAVNLDGLNEGLVTYSLNHGDINVTSDIANTDDSQILAGGISGSYGDISYCENRGDITINTTCIAYAGGISGYLPVSVVSCKNIGTVSATADFGAYVGGIVGQFGITLISDTAKVTDSENAGKVSASVSGQNVRYTPDIACYAGGIAGYAAGDASATQITAVKNTGEVIASVTDDSLGVNAVAGGIVGSSYADISDCLNTASVTGDNNGPIFGAINESGENLGTVTSSYHAKSIVTCTPLVGNTSTDTTGITELADDALKLKASYVGFDFDNQWTISDGDTSANLTKVATHTHYHRETNHTEATCQTPESKEFSCPFCLENYTENGTDLADHVFENYQSDNNATCFEDGTKTATCTTEGCTVTDVKADEGSATGDHVFTNYVSNNDASCYKDGTKTATCDTEGCGKTDTTADPDHPATGEHVWGTYVSNNDATCYQDGTKTAQCQTPGCTATDVKADEGTATGNHVYGEYVSNGDASCFEDGTKTASCTTEGCTATDVKADEGSATGNHVFTNYVSNNDASCYKDGTKTATCDTEGCTAKDTVKDTGSATGEHVFGEYVYNNDATKLADGTETAECTTEGCTAADTRTKAGTKLPSVTFTDVKKGAFYEEAVDWAVANGITTGATATTFEPGSECTRAQAVTFLWRTAGSPEPTVTKTSFTDIKETGFYYKAVLWAVENGITTGTSATTFSPNDKCTRGQIVTFLWRAAGSPKVSIKSPFTDVKSTSFCYGAVLWAVENGITTGTTATTFAPNQDCTRGHIVTFLYRAQSEK